MTTTTTTTGTEMPVDYSAVTTIVDTIIRAEATESVAWLNLHDACESADDVTEAWTAARDHYVATYPKGKSGRATRPADTFKARKSDVVRVRKSHPKMDAQSIVDQYGSVRSAATAIRKQIKDDAAPVAPVEVLVTADERLAAITSAVRLAVSAGLADDQIMGAVSAGLTA